MGLLDRFRRPARPKVRTPGADDPGSGAPASAQQGATAALARGHALLAQGAHAEALAAYREAIDAGDSVAAHLGQARTYAALGQADEAADSLEVAIALDPRCVEALVMLADTRLRQGAAEAAVEPLRAALRTAPERADLHFRLGLALNRSGDTQAALAAYREAIRLDPYDPAPHVNLGLIFIQQLGRADEAEAAFRHALALAPGDLAATANLGLALQDLGRAQEALDLYEQALVRHPDAVELRWNRGVANLLLGRFEPGWADYALRVHRSGGRDIGTFPYPDWDGASIANGSLLVLAEQGLGDEIMFASCLPDLEAAADRVVLECAPRLEPLFRRSFPWVRVHGVERRAAPDWLAAYPDIRAKILIGGLPRLMRRRAEDFPRHTGYLRADPVRIDAALGRLKSLDKGLRVGVSWRGGTRSTRGELRSMPIENLRALTACRTVRCICLQHDPTAAERAFARETGIEIWDDFTADLEGTAALVKTLDLVVSVPNTNAHLAGALGTPVWLMLNSAPEWRWQAEGHVSPWYPSARLVRAPRPNEWGSVLKQIRSMLDAADGYPADGSP